MTLEELKDFFEKQPAKKVFNYGLSSPFSWRGKYDEIAFSIEEGEFSREQILENIEKGLTEQFNGYKGGKYKYNEYTTVNFEEDYSSYTDGSYLLNKLFKFLF